MKVIPPRFCDGDQVTAVLLYNSFQLLLFITHAACIGVDALELGYRSHPQPVKKHLRKILVKTSFSHV